MDDLRVIINNSFIKSFHGKKKKTIIVLELPHP